MEKGTGIRGIMSTTLSRRAGRVNKWKPCKKKNGKHAVGETTAKTKSA